MITSSDRNLFVYQGESNTKPFKFFKKFVFGNFYNIFLYIIGQYMPLEESPDK